jgi:hypothetical protein
MYDYDEIDRALFALPLEAPPAALRQSILNCTVNAPAAVRASALAWWETLGIGAVAALAIWLTVAVLTGASAGAAIGSAFTSFGAAFTSFGRSLSDPTTLGWLTVGASAALWLSFLSLRPARAVVRSGRS